MHPDGTNRRLLSTRLSGGGYGLGRMWLPDSQTLALGVLERERPPRVEGEVFNWEKHAFIGSNIKLVDVTTKQERLLVTDGVGEHIDLSPSPDGTKLVFASQPEWL